MKDLTFDKKQLKLFKSLTDSASVEIIWDMNAFYFNTDSKTYKLECFDEKPLGSDFLYDEIFYCKFLELNKPLKFDENDSKFWYKKISKDCKILSFQFINIIQLFPDDIILPIKNANMQQDGINFLTVGVIVETSEGFLPAFLLPSNHGFQWQPKFDFYSKDEIHELLSENLEYYEKNNCA